MGQYSSLYAVVISPDAVDIGDEVLGRVLGRVWKRRGKRRRETGEGQNEDATNRQANTHRGWHEDGMSARYTDTLGGSS